MAQEEGVTTGITVEALQFGQTPLSQSMVGEGGEVVVSMLLGDQIAAITLTPRQGHELAAILVKESIKASGYKIAGLTEKEAP